MGSGKRARIIRVPFGLGASNPTGLELGPTAVEALIWHRIRELQLDATGNSSLAPLTYRLEVDSIMVSPAPVQPQRRQLLAELKNLEAVAELCGKLRDTVRQVLREDPGNPVLPVILGGDHSIAIGSVAGVRSARPQRKLGVIWIDSHADYHTGYRGSEIGDGEYETWWKDHPTTKKRQGTTFSGYIHGMSLAVLTGQGDTALTSILENQFVDPKNVVLVGTREVDREERDWVHFDKLRCVSARGVHFWGVPATVQSLIRYLSQQEVEAVHISLDIDALDASLVPGTGTPVSGGLSYAQADLMLKLLRDWLKEAGIEISSFELVEVNPLLDRDNRTADLAARLVCTILGEEILVEDRFPRPEEDEFLPPFMLQASSGGKPQ